jgi:hypothetical protein
VSKLEFTGCRGGDVRPPSLRYRGRAAGRPVARVKFSPSCMASADGGRAASFLRIGSHRSDDISTC